jgi:heptosyltransferase-2
MLPDLSAFKNIAIIQTAFLGDVVLVLSFAQFLKDRQPDVKLTLITTPAATSVAQCSVALDNVVAYDKRGEFSGFSGIKKFVHTLRDHNFDCILSPHRSFRTSLLTQLLKPTYSVGFKNAAGSFLYSETVQYQQHLHEIERNFLLLKAFKNGAELLKANAPAVKIIIPDADREYTENLLLKNNIVPSDSMVMLAPGSVWATKRWRTEHFKKLADDLLKDGHKVILTGGKEDQILCSEIAGNSEVKNLAGQTTLPQTLALLKKTSVLVCNDSAPTHLAGLVQCPVISIFGPTSPIFGFAPRGKFDEIIQSEHLQCRPCQIHGGNVCPIGTHECMKSVTPEIVLKTVGKVLKRRLEFSA